VALPGDLQEVLDEAMRLLSHAAADPRSPAHTPTVATVGLDGAPRLRTVVLRGFDAARRELRFHADARSPKVAELGRDPRLGLHVYDPAARVQVRLDVVATLHASDAVADAAWAASQPMSRVCYGAVPAQGTAIGEGGAYALPASDAQVEAGRTNFVAVIGRIQTLDWLHLAAAGHRRASFRWTGEACGATWRVP
jgi:pyridoxamine 5'-phosphate oxidase